MFYKLPFLLPKFRSTILQAHCSMYVVGYSSMYMVGYSSMFQVSSINTSWNGLDGVVQLTTPFPLRPPH